MMFGVGCSFPLVLMLLLSVPGVCVGQSFDPTSYTSNSELANFHWDPTWRAASGSMLVTFTASAQHDILFALTNDNNIAPQTSQAWAITLGGWAEGVDGLPGPRSGVLQGTQAKMVSSTFGNPCSSTGKNYWVLLNNGVLSVGTGDVGTNQILDSVQVGTIAPGFTGNAATRLGLSSWNVPVTYTNIKVQTYPQYVSNSEMANFAHWTQVPTSNNPNVGSMLATFTGAAQHDILMALTSDAFPVASQTQQAWAITLGGWANGINGLQGPLSAILQGIQGPMRTFIGPQGGNPTDPSGLKYWLVLNQNSLSVGTGTPGTNTILNLDLSKYSGFSANTADKLGLSSYNVPVSYTDIYVSFVCPKTGTYNTGSHSCASCPVGTASNFIGANSCQQCPAGSYADQTGAAICTPCKAGTFSTTVGATNSQVCLPCSPGTWSQPGASKCVLCGSTTNAQVNNVAAATINNNNIVDETSTDATTINSNNKSMPTTTAVIIAVVTTFVATLMLVAMTGAIVHRRVNKFQINTQSAAVNMEQQP